MSPTATRKRHVRSPKSCLKTGRFWQEYEKLNPEQQRAVETIEGPVMVVAGPGTGKTQVTAMRVANILTKTQMRGSNILCLTFSNSGAVAMQERLRTLIGLDAYSVTVSTIHGFCNDVIASHPHVFEEWEAFEQVSNIERYRILNTIIDQFFSQSKLLNKKLPYSKTRDIIHRISQVKREGASSVAHLKGVASQYAHTLSLQSRSETKAHARDLLSAERFSEFTEIFFRYQEMLKETRRYDYEDMILLCLQACLEEDWLLASLQERYQYILVDEFQDTNGAQEKFIEVLTLYPHLSHEPNLFVVGDDDQAIYRFQGANIQNFLSFRGRFPHAPVIVLRECYRCPQGVLDAAGKLITQNHERLTRRVAGLEKVLVSGKREKPAAPSLHFHLVPTDSAEFFLIADCIEERLKRGVLPEGIAILTQTNRELPLYEELLKARGVPVAMQGKLDLLSHTKVQQLSAILRAIASPSESSALASALSCECFGCHPADLGRLWLWRRDRQCPLLDVLLSFEREGGWTEFHSLEYVIHARDTLIDLHQKLGSRTLPETLEHALRECGFLIQGQNFDPVDFVPLQTFFDYVKERCSEQPSFSLEQLLSDLAYYSDPSYGDLRLRYEPPRTSTGGVQLLTIHQSKGLEFSTVILPRFAHGHWDHRRAPPSFPFPEDLLFGWEKERKAFEAQEDERRLLYVALTRAKEEVILTCPEEWMSGERRRTLEPSRFLAEIGAVPTKRHPASSPALPPLLLVRKPRMLDQEFRAFLLDRLKNVHLSVTALNHFLEDPQQFLELDLLHVPQASESSFVYGNAVHWALRQWGINVQGGRGMEEGEFVEEFWKYLREREVLTGKERERLGVLGGEALPRYYRERLHMHVPSVYRVEGTLMSHLGDIPLKGKIDRIDLLRPNSSAALVMDFKTGRPKTEKEIREGAYFRQLVFYALLLERELPMLTPERFILDFVGEGEHEPIIREFAITEGEKEELATLIREVWRKITLLDFSPLVQ